MEKYLICFDLDDTLLNKKKKIPFLARIGIYFLLKNGHYIILNSGRPIQGVLPYIKKLKLYNYPFVCSNGSCIYFVNRKLEITKTYSYPLDTIKMNDFMNEIKDFLVYACMQGISERFYFNENDVPDFMKHDEKHTQIFNITSFNIKNPIIMGAFAIKKEEDKKFKKIISKNKYKSLSVFCWGESNNNIYYDIQSLGINKGYAMTVLMEKYKIKKENTIAFGDELNDISMLSLAYYGCIMPKGKEIGQKYGFKILKKDSDRSSSIRYLLKNHKHLF